ncbi:hypothetical protein HYH03_008155 [Edaphochlamys debaryana]|uniref:Uncharacterized protein n=1 Tax=Edaphochlamys debaryana TaxID=47281 RepID=A0A835Y0G2_9CHLO|nr:hypothetical protein HYH03_008155 [Edaphochlamys debaryana]|eukprot:KAG2493638.1 hypothetical protein HYH03_008155 [Edaphochlamys debaryana]
MAAAAVAVEGPSTAATPAFTTPIAVTQIDESQYRPQLDTKLAKLKELFAEFNPPEVEVFESPPSYYRMRAEFTVETRDGGFHYVMFDKSPGPDAEPGAAADGPSAGLEGAEAAGRPDGDSDAEAGEAGEEEAGPSTSAPAAAEVAAAGAGRGKRKRKVKKSRPPGPRRVRVESFPVASRQVNELMEAVKRVASEDPELRTRLFQANFHTALSGDAMVTLLYHRRLGPEWEAAAERLRDALAATPTAAAAGKRPHVIGRSRKQVIHLSAGHVEEVLHVGGRPWIQRQVEGSFSQPNGAVCQHMLGWALGVTRPATAGAGAAAAAGPEAGTGAEPGAQAQAQGEAQAQGPQDDLLELYCGNGNFTIPLAQNFRRVVATEVAKSSVDAARYNLEANGVSNVFLARMASEEFAQTMRERGTRRRLEGLGPWEELRLRTILVDPPRVGLDEFTVELLREFDNVIYISCNPDTLAANLRSLGPSFAIRKWAAFDQFPFTHHLECGVYLTRV